MLNQIKTEISQAKNQWYLRTYTVEAVLIVDAILLIEDNHSN